MGGTVEISVFWLGLAGLIVASVLIAQLPLSRFTGKEVPLIALQRRLRLDGLNSGFFFLLCLVGIALALLWLVILWLLLAGLVGQIQLVIETGWESTAEAESEWRFTLTKLVALTSVSIATIALPFTGVRLWLNQQQTATAKDALFNDKIDVAVTDLYAQRQVTLKPDDKGNYFNGWEDDITRRNGAIDRLEGLVEEDETLAPRVSRMLSVYVRELSRHTAKPEEPEEDLDPEALWVWARGLDVKRSDMEKAVQTLGRLPVLTDGEGDPVRPALAGANLQSYALSRLNFEGADLIGARLQGASLFHAQLQGADLREARLQGADLREARLQGAHLIEAELEGASLIEAELEGASLVRAQLQGASLVRAQLQGADLDGAELEGASLVRARLQGASLVRAELQGASLVRARLQGANLVRAEFDETTDLTAATLRGAAVRSADFRTVAQIEPHLDTLFGDATVKLPERMARPDRFNVEYEDWDAFEEAWREFQRSIEQDPENPE